MNSAALVHHLFRRSARLGRKRMSLTIAAVAWGTLSIVLLLSFGEGLKRAFARNSRGMGEGIAVVWPSQTTLPWKGLPEGRDVKVRVEDLAALSAQAPELGTITPEFSRWSVSLSAGSKTLNKRVAGVAPEYGGLRNLVPLMGGRFLDALDLRDKRRVVFLGDGLARDLFGAADPVGKSVTIARVPFTVIGVMRHKTQMGMYSGPDEDHAFIPHTTFAALWGARKVDNLLFKPPRPELMDAAKKKLNQLLAARFRYDPADENALGIWDTQQSQKVTTYIGLGIQIFLGIIGALTLIISGVGVANIMYAVARQRTRELAIQMAMGARPGTLVWPLVLEGLMLTATGGALGLALGSALVGALGFIATHAKGKVFEFLGAPTFSMPVAISCIALLAIIGLLSGWFPARRAVALEPARVLRED